MKRRTFTARDSASVTYTWKFWHDANAAGAGLWFLEDPEEHVRVLARTWIDSVPEIRLILANHDQTTDVILENLR